MIWQLAIHKYVSYICNVKQDEIVITLTEFADYMVQFLV